MGSLGSAVCELVSIHVSHVKLARSSESGTRSIFKMGLSPIEGVIKRDGWREKNNSMTQVAPSQGTQRGAECHPSAWSSQPLFDHLSYF